MLKNTLLEIVRTFNKVELKRLDDFVQSPYFNSKSTVTKLYYEIKKFAPDFNNKNLDRKKIWAKLFPGKEFNYGVMKNLIYDLQKITEKFLGQQYYELNRKEQQMNLLNNYLSRELSQLYEKNFKVFRNESEVSKFDLEYYYYKFLIDASRKNYLIFNHKNKDPDFLKSDRMNENLTAYYYIILFSENYNTILESRYYNIKIDNKHINKGLKDFDKSIVRDNELARMYYHSLKAIINKDNEVSYFILKKLLIKNLSFLSHIVKFNLSMSLINFCSNKIMMGDVKFIEEQFMVYKFMIENNFYSAGENKYMNQYMFANVVNSASVMKEFNWAEEFIENFKKKISPLWRDQFYYLSLVNLNLKRKNFSKALGFLSKAAGRNVIEKINIRRYQIIIYYELGYVNELYSYIDACKHFISNDKKTSSEVKNILNNFITAVQKLAALKFSPDNYKDNGFLLKNLRTELDSRNISNKLWLLEKISELENNLK